MKKKCKRNVFCVIDGAKWLTAVFAVAALQMAYGAYYYVDANNGNDTWDGTTATIPDQAVIDAGGAVAGPRKTLHAMMSDERVVAGDTVWAAEGDYNEGGAVNGTKVTLNRVQVKGGVMLRASGSRDNTFISGADGADGAYSTGATRCVFFLPPAKEADGYGIVKGFTIRNGRTAVSGEFGGGSSGSGLLVECDFRNNGCSEASRGGTMFFGTALRCRFSTVHSNNGYIAWTDTNSELVYIISSLIAVSSGRNGFYQRVKVCNSTFSGDGYVRNCDTYNCLFIGDGVTSGSQISSNSKAYHFNTFSRFDFNTDACSENSECRVVTAPETPYDETTFRPLAGSVVVDVGSSSDSKAAEYNYENLTNGWPTAWLAEAGKDYYGGERVVNGAIDIGCGEMQPVEGAVLTIADSLNDLAVSGDVTEKGEFELEIGKDYTITVSRSFKADLLCKGVVVNGVYHSFGGSEIDTPYVVNLRGRAGQYSYITAVYETNPKDWYVSPTGNNENKGYHRNCPRRTLDKAMELATENAGHIVHAAAGTYDSFADGEEYASANSRVTVKAGVGLVADDWPLKETIIKGASDTTSETKDEYGNGPNAVRCVTVMTNGYVRGFKLTGGRTKLSADTGTDVEEDAGAFGGGAFLYAPAALVDCELTGNGANYRGSVAASVRERTGDLGWFIRCYAHDNDANGGNYQIFDSTGIVDCYIDSGENTGCYCRRSSIILNSTIKGTARAWNTMYAYNSYISQVSRLGGTFTLTNCALASAENTTEGIAYESCIFSVANDENIDGSYRPKTAASVLVDAGNKDYYDEKFPAQFAQFRTDRDFAGGQRVYNGKIDIGCGEYDFRGDFAKMLGARAVISEMGPNVTTNAVQDIVVPEGESIAMSVAPLATDRNTQYKLVYTPEGGSQTVISENSTDAFTRALDGPCTVQTLTGYLGFVFQVR